jgi:hypothetical protein
MFSREMTWEKKCHGKGFMAFYFSETTLQWLEIPPLGEVTAVVGFEG